MLKTCFYARKTRSKRITTTIIPMPIVLRFQNSAINISKVSKNKNKTKVRFSKVSYSQ